MERSIKRKMRLELDRRYAICKLQNSHEWSYTEPKGAPPYIPGTVKELIFERMQCAKCGYRMKRTITYDPDGVKCGDWVPMRRKLDEPFLIQTKV